MPNTKIQQLVDQRARAIAENRTLLDRADESGGTLSAEAASEYDQRDAEIDALQDQIDRLHKQDAHDAAVQARAAEAVRAHVPAAAVAPATEERAGTFGQMPELGIRAYDLIRAGSPEYREGMLRYLRTGARPVEARAMEAGVNSEGGYYVHTQMQESIQRKREETSFIRRLAAPRSRPVVRRSCSPKRQRSARQSGSPKKALLPRRMKWSGNRVGHPTASRG